MELCKTRFSCQKLGFRPVTCFYCVLEKRYCHLFFLCKASFSSVICLFESNANSALYENLSLRQSFSRSLEPGFSLGPKSKIWCSNDLICEHALRVHTFCIYTRMLATHLLLHVAAASLNALISWGVLEAFVSTFILHSQMCSRFLVLTDFYLVLRLRNF